METDQQLLPWPRMYSIIFKKIKLNSGKTKFHWFSGAGLGAAFLMANSSIGPGFLTQTTVFTQQLLSSFGFVILVSFILIPKIINYFEIVFPLNLKIYSFFIIKKDIFYKCKSNYIDSEFLSAKNHIIRIIIMGDQNK